MPEDYALNLPSFENFCQEMQGYSRWDYKQKYDTMYLLSSMLYNSPSFSEADLELFDLAHFFVREGWFRVLSFRPTVNFDKKPLQAGKISWINYCNFLLEKVVQSFIGEHFSSYSAHFGGRFISVICLMNGETSGQVTVVNQKVNAQIDLIISFMQESLGLSVTCFSSSFCSSPSMLSMAFAQAMDEENLSHFLHRKYVHSDSFDSINDFSREWRNYDTLARFAVDFIQACQRQDEVAARQMAEECIDFLLLVPNCTMDRIHHRLIFLMRELFRLAEQAPLFKQFTWKNTVLPILNPEGESDLRQKFYKYCANVYAAYENLSLQSKKNARYKYKRIYDYIQNNSADPHLNLGHIAEKFSLNANALSSGFKRTYDITVSALICQLRIETAKTLLRAPETSLSAAAEQAGFGSVNTMYRVFKKFTGSTPGAWRGRYHKKNDKSQTGM